MGEALCAPCCSLGARQRLGIKATAFGMPHMIRRGCYAAFGFAINEFKAQRMMHAKVRMHGMRWTPRSKLHAGHDGIGLCTWVHVHGDAIAAGMATDGNDMASWIVAMRYQFDALH